MTRQGRIGGAFLPALLAVGIATGAQAATLEEIEEAEAAVYALWEDAELQFRRALFVEPGDLIFGSYVERESASFATGEPIIVYAEPIGHGWRQTGDGDYAFGFDIDIIIKTPSGRIIFGQEDFQQIDLRNRHRIRELMLHITLDLDGAPPGDYVLDYRVRDRIEDKSAMISLPFSIE